MDWDYWNRWAHPEQYRDVYDPDEDAADEEAERVAEAIFKFLVDKDVAMDLYNGRWETASPRMKQTFIKLVETWVMD